jgi:hypothetical protein
MELLQFDKAWTWGSTAPTSYHQSLKIKGQAPTKGQIANYVMLLQRVSSYRKYHQYKLCSINTYYIRLKNRNMHLKTLLYVLEA